MHIRRINEYEVVCILDNNDMEEYDISIELIQQAKDNEEIQQQLSDFMQEIFKQIHDYLINKDNEDNEDFFENVIGYSARMIINIDSIAIVYQKHEPPRRHIGQNKDDFPMPIDNEDITDEDKEDFVDLMTTLGKLLTGTLSEEEAQQFLDKRENKEDTKEDIKEDKPSYIRHFVDKKHLDKKTLDKIEEYEFSFKFDGIEKVIDFCKGVYNGKIDNAILYKINNRTYELACNKKMNAYEYQDFLRLLCEFYITNDIVEDVFNDFRSAFLEEHYNDSVIIKGNAIEQLYKL